MIIAFDTKRLYLHLKIDRVLPLFKQCKFIAKIEKDLQCKLDAFDTIISLADH